MSCEECERTGERAGTDINRTPTAVHPTAVQLVRMVRMVEVSRVKRLDMILCIFDYAGVRSSARSRVVSEVSAVADD